MILAENVGAKRKPAERVGSKDHMARRIERFRLAPRHFREQTAHLGQLTPRAQRREELV